MTALVVILGVACAVLLTVTLARERSHRKPRLATPSPTRVVFPFTGMGLSQRGLDAALRLARIDNATLVPVLLVQVPLHLPLDAALPAQCDAALPLLEAVEQRAVRSGIAVDSRIERGRSYRHALRELLAHDRFDTVVVTAADSGGGSAGLSPDDISWLLENVPGEIIVIRPGSVDLQDFLLGDRATRMRRRQVRPTGAAGARARPRLRFLVSGGRGAPS